MKLTLNEIQKEHKEWSWSNFGDINPTDLIVGIMEELGELSHSHLKESHSIRTNEDHPSKIKDAIGDIVIFLIAYCNARGINFEDVVQETWAIVKQRDWKKNKETGRV